MKPINEGDVVLQELLELGVTMIFPAEWKEVTAASPCPMCKHGGWCNVSTDGAVMCRRVSIGGKEKTDKSGATYWLHLRNGSHLANGNRTPKSDYEPPKFTMADGKGEKADPDTLHTVYSAIIRALTLKASHEEGLKARSLKTSDRSAREIAKDLGYVSLDQRRWQAVEAAKKADLEQYFPRVPGFYIKEDKHGRKKWSLKGSAGMVIPVRDPKGRIAALQVRLDEKRANGCKYQYVSSKKASGPGPNAPLHFPLFDGDKKTDHGSLLLRRSASSHVRTPAGTVGSSACPTTAGSPPTMTPSIQTETMNLIIDSSSSFFDNSRPRPRSTPSKKGCFANGLNPFDSTFVSD